MKLNTLLPALSFLTMGLLPLRGNAQTQDTSTHYLHEVSSVWPSMQHKEHDWLAHRSDGHNIYRVSTPTLEHFSATSQKAVIVCPGGGYQMLAYQKEGQEIAQWLQKQGYDAYVLAYRVPDNRVGALQDVQRAIRIARSNGAQTVGVIGFSAGASLSCRAATRWDEQTYTPADRIDSLSCRPDFGILIYPAYLDEGENHTLTPELRVNSQTPPLFVFGTQDDKLYSGPSCITIVGAMQQAGAPIELHYLPKGGHGYGMRRGAGKLWPKLAELWLRTL